MINQLAKEIHENAKSKGFFDAEKNIGEMLALIHSEVSEALEADRKNHYAQTEHYNLEYNRFLTLKYPEVDAFKFAFDAHIKNSFEDELADIIIRVLDLAAFKGVNIEEHIKVKMRRNTLREHKHGKKY